MYSTINNTMKKLKASFVEMDEGKKMEELKETLPLIK
jgi:hypothetical protein